MTHAVSSYAIHTSKKRGYSDIEIDPLHTVGYRVFKSAVDITDSLLAEAKAKAAYSRRIFNRNEMNVNDGNRSQVNLKKCSAELEKFIETLNQFILTHISDELKPADWVAIRSKPGCQDQAAHTDYVPDLSLAMVQDSFMPLSVLVCLMPETTLNVWPSSIKLTSLTEELLSKAKVIHCKVEKLEPGDILVFRGDLVHAGSSYENENIRLHAFLDSPLVPRTPNRTFIIHERGSEQLRRIIKPK